MCVAYSCWSVDLPEWPSLPEKISQISPNVCVISLLICWWEIEAGREEIWHCAQIPVDVLIYHPAQHWPRKELKFLPVCASYPCWYVDYPVPVQWPKNWKIRYSAQIPVDLLIYQNEHLCPRNFSIFTQCVRHILVYLLMRNWSRQ